MFRGSLVYLIPAVLVLGIILILGQRSKPQTLGASFQAPAASPSPSPSPTALVLMKSSSPTSSPQVSDVPTNSQILDWQYPGSKILSNSGSDLELESDQAARIITDWYKNKITSSGMRVKTFVTTKNNDNVLNKLSGSSGGEDVSVEVSQPSGQSTVKISVKI